MWNFCQRIYLQHKKLFRTRISTCRGSFSKYTSLDLRRLYYNNKIMEFSCTTSKSCQCDIHKRIRALDTAISRAARKGDTTKVESLNTERRMLRETQTVERKRERRRTTTPSDHKTVRSSATKRSQGSVSSETVRASHKKTRQVKDQVEQRNRNTIERPDGTKETKEESTIRSISWKESLEITRAVKMAEQSYVQCELQRTMERSHQLPMDLTVEDFLLLISRPDPDFAGYRASIGTDTAPENCAQATIQFMEQCVITGHLPAYTQRWQLYRVEECMQSSFNGLRMFGAGTYTDKLQWKHFSRTKQPAYGERHAVWAVFAQRQEDLDAHSTPWECTWVKVRVQSPPLTYSLWIPSPFAFCIFNNKLDLAVLKNAVRGNAPAIIRTLDAPTHSPWEETCVVTLEDGTERRFDQAVVKRNQELYPILQISQTQREQLNQAAAARRALVGQTEQKEYVSSDIFPSVAAKRNVRFLKRKNALPFTYTEHRSGAQINAKRCRSQRMK